MESITLSTDGKSYTLRPLGTNELCELQVRLGLHFGAIMEQIGALGIEGMNLETVRVFLQTCMNEKLTLDEIGTLIDAVGFDGISAAVNGLIIPAQERHGG